MTRLIDTLESQYFRIRFQNLLLDFAFTVYSKRSTPNVHSRGTDKLGTPSPSVPRQRRELGSNFGCLPSKLLNCVEPHHFAYKFNS